MRQETAKGWTLPAEAIVVLSWSPPGCHSLMLQGELQRLRRQAAEQEAARHAQAMAAAVQAAAMAPRPTSGEEQMQRTLKISWDPQVYQTFQPPPPPLLFPLRLLSSPRITHKYLMCLQCCEKVEVL